MPRTVRCSPLGRRERTVEVIDAEAIPVHAGGVIERLRVDVDGHVFRVDRQHG